MDSQPVASTDDQTPLRAAEVWKRLHISNEARDPVEIIGGTAVRQQVLEEFKPLTASLEWELSRLHWERAGTLPFAENEVPFLVNNSGRLAEDAALLLFQNCLEAPPEEPLIVLELGAGCGLFARAVVEALRLLCVHHGRDFFTRLRYVATDGSSRTLHDWAVRGVFETNGAHFHPMLLRADDAATFAERLRTIVNGAGSIRAVFCNYVLDVLDSRVVRRGTAGIEELQVRTLLSAEPAALREYTSRSLEELRCLAEASDPAQRAELIPLLSLFDIEAAFRPLSGAAHPALAAALDLVAASRAVLVNTAALDCLAALRAVLHPNGFVLINDYGPTDLDQSRHYPVSQHFGRTTAQAINFPVFDALAGAAWSVVVPPGDVERAIHSRLLVHGELPQTRDCFAQRFSATAQAEFEVPLLEARQHCTAGRRNDALLAFRTAIERSPRDWRVLGEAAEFTGLELRDFASGAELARSALELNPWYSTWLWNVLGDCLYCAERYLDAHQAYLQAQRIHPRDPRTLLNLAYTQVLAGDHVSALQSIGLGLACDQGPFRERLLEKQAAILASADLRRSGEHKRMVLAASRLQLGDATVPPPS